MQGTSIGRAVHAVLQVVDLRTGNGLEDIAKAQAAAEGVPGRADDIARLVRRALDSPLVKRALESGHWWRETPVAGPVGDGIVEGFIDLLFEEEDGFVIVDYKTDALGSDDEIERAMARYRLQGGGYALALSRATGANIKEVSFLFLEPSRDGDRCRPVRRDEGRRGRGSRLVCGRSCPMMTRVRLTVLRVSETRWGWLYLPIHQTTADRGT